MKEVLICMAILWLDFFVMYRYRVPKSISTLEIHSRSFRLNLQDRQTAHSSNHKILALRFGFTIVPKFCRPARLEAAKAKSPSCMTYSSKMRYIISSFRSLASKGNRVYWGPVPVEAKELQVSGTVRLFYSFTP